MEDMAQRFDQQVDWQAYDAPLEGDPIDVLTNGSTSAGSSDVSSSRTPSPAPSSVPGAYLPPHRRRGDGDAVLGIDGQVARVSRRGNLKVLGATPDLTGAFRKVQRVPYALTKDQVKYLEHRFPSTFFCVYKDQNHDHPIAHLETMIATRHVLDSIRDNTSILDVYGNPGARDTFMLRNDLRGRTMETLVNCQSEKDYLRKVTKWGPAADAAGVPRYHDMSIDDMLHPDNLDWSTQFGVYLFVHTAYYIPMHKIAQLLSNNREAHAKFVVHRHANEQGGLFGGEIEYVNRHGFVVQRNVQTGERYIHPSLEWMFQSTTKVWRGSDHALTWSFNRVTDETWILDVAWCPNNLDERFDAYAHQYSGDRLAAADRMNDEALIDTAMTVRLPQFAEANVRSVAGVLLVTPTGFAKPLRLTQMPFFEYLAGSIVGKKRDKTVLGELFALARRENTLTSSYPTAKRFTVPHDEVGDHVVGAFISGMYAESNLLQIVAGTQHERSVHSRLLDDRVVDMSSVNGKVTTALKTAQVVNRAFRSRDATGALLDYIEQNVA